MKFIVLVHKQVPRTVNAGGQLRIEPVTVEVPVLEQRSFDPDEEIPEARYVPYDWVMPGDSQAAPVEATAPASHPALTVPAVEDAPREPNAPTPDTPTPNPPKRDAA